MEWNSGHGSMAAKGVCAPGFAVRLRAPAALRDAEAR
jgi:hypothetical protein